MCFATKFKFNLIFVLLLKNLCALRNRYDKEFLLQIENKHHKLTFSILHSDCIIAPGYSIPTHGGQHDWSGDRTRWRLTAKQGRLRLMAEHYRLGKQRI